VQKREYQKMYILRKLKSIRSKQYLTSEQLKKLETPLLMAMHLAYVAGMASVLVGMVTASPNVLAVGVMLWLGSLAMILVRL
jgi:hypothetical protein